MSRHVFISHSEEDKASAELLLNALENRGVRCWIAPRDVPPGGSYAEAILTAIENSTCFVLVYTEHCNVSSHVLREVERALKFGLNIIPVRFDDSTPSKGLDYLLATVQWLSVTYDSIDRDVARAAEQISSCVLPGADAAPPLVTGLAPAVTTRAQKPAPANGATKRKHEQATAGQPCDKEAAWLETSGDKFPIRGDCSLGRSPKNTIVLDSQKVSRRHAIINVQNIGEFWLIDLGSINGTFLNHRRLNQPVRLSDHDQVVIGDQIFIFHQPEEITDEYRTTFAQRTIREIANVPCWLLVADIEEFTSLSRSLTSDRLATLIGGWVATCKEIIEYDQGTIDKSLGDGFLAYWREGPSATKNVAMALGKLKEAQVQNEPRFRIALHYGFVAVGGMPSMGEESLMGREVNFVFRMEKLAGSLGISVLTSAAGKSKFGKLIKTEPAGSHELKGFEGKHEFFRC